MSNRSSERTPTGFLKMIVDRVGALERRTVKPISGPTPRRDFVYPPPTDAEGRLALANQGPVWYNSDLGRWEGYFSPMVAGLTVRPLASGNAAGWYPLIQTSQAGPPFAP